MRFEAGVPVVSPQAEWMARVSPFLAADDPHQACVKTAWDHGIDNVNLVCTCPVAPCTKECCVPVEDEL